MTAEVGMTATAQGSWTVPQVAPTTEDDDEAAQPEDAKQP